MLRYVQEVLQASGPPHLGHSVCGAEARYVPGEDTVLVGAVQVIW